MHMNHIKIKISYLMHCHSDAETAIENLFTGTIEFYDAKQYNFTNRIGIIRNDQKYESNSEES